MDAEPLQLDNPAFVDAHHEWHVMQVAAAAGHDKAHKVAKKELENYLNMAEEAQSSEEDVATM